LGKALRLTGSYEEALKELRFVEAKRPDDETVHAQLASLYKAMGDAKHAQYEMNIHQRQRAEKFREAQKATTSER
jgi:Flp pilus assembly protein TadD